MTRSRVAAMSPAEPELKAFAQDVGRNAPSKLPPTVVVQISARLRRWGLDRSVENLVASGEWVDNSSTGAVIAKVFQSR